MQAESLQEASPHHHRCRHYRDHDRCHHRKKQRIARRLLKHGEPCAFENQFHPTFRAFASVRLTNFAMHGAEIDAIAVGSLIHGGNLPTLETTPFMGSDIEEDQAAILGLSG